jgi:hypothetical protein
MHSPYGFNPPANTTDLIPPPPQALMCSMLSNIKKRSEGSATATNGGDGTVVVLVEQPTYFLSGSIFGSCGGVKCVGVAVTKGGLTKAALIEATARSVEEHGVKFVKCGLLTSAVCQMRFADVSSFYRNPLPGSYQRCCVTLTRTCDVTH